MAEKQVSMQVRVPKSWSEMFKDEGRSQLPPITRELVLYRVLEKAVERMIRRESK